MLSLRAELDVTAPPQDQSWVADARNDSDLSKFVEQLLSATWEDWQLVHHRVVAIPRPLNIYEDLKESVGESAAAQGSGYANAIGVLVNRVVLDRYVRAATETADPRASTTWLEILAEHDGPPTGALFQAVWAIVLRHGLSIEVRAQSGQAYARCVDPGLFELGNPV